MTRLLWLPDRLRSWGLPVVEHADWTSLGVPFDATPQVAVGHHTATPAKVHGDLPTLRILTYGRGDLPGPLCQVALSRSGVAHVIASGKANHAGPGRWAGITRSSLTVGCEVEHPGVGPWPPQLLAAFDRVMAALLDGLDLPASRYCGHREWATPAGRKPDPAGVDLNLQRQRLHQLLVAGPPSAAQTEGDFMAALITADGHKMYASDATGAHHLDRPTLLAMQRTGTLPSKPRHVDQGDLDVLLARAKQLTS